jgi:uncharacterized protein (TIGR02996 family)
MNPLADPHSPSHDVADDSARRAAGDLYRQAKADGLVGRIHLRRVRAAAGVYRQARTAAEKGGSQDAVRSAREAYLKAFRELDPFPAHRPFFRAIDAAPYDPHPVLAWADWLEKNSEGFPNAAAVRLAAEIGVLPQEMAGSWVMAARPATKIGDKVLSAINQTMCGSPSAIWISLAKREQRPRTGPGMIIAPGEIRKAPRKN